MSSSRSLLYSGEGDASSASGEAMISLYSWQRAQMLLCCCAGCRGRWRRRRGVGAASSTQPNGSARTARGDPAACFRVNHACAGCSTVAAVHFDSSRTEARGGASRRAAVNPAGGYRIILSWYKAGVAAVEWALQLHTESWYMAGCYQDTRPITVGTRPWDVRCTLQRAPGQSMVGWGGVGSEQQGREGAKEHRSKGSSNGRRCGTLLGEGCVHADAVETLEEQLLEMC
jgi:hypothetical protein